MVKIPDGTATVIIQGKKRFTVEEIIQEQPFFKARITEFDERLSGATTEERNALVESLKDQIDTSMTY